MGLIPVVHILRSNLAEVIHRSSRSAPGGRGVRVLSSILVTGQVAVALVLLSGAADLGDAWRVYAEGDDSAVFVARERVFRWTGNRFKLMCQFHTSCLPVASAHWASRVVSFAFASKNPA
jgi:hypothetical protein